MTKKIKFEDKKIKNILTIIAIIVFISLGIRDLFFVKSEFILDVLGSIILLVIFYKFYDKMHQDYVSYFFLILIMILHNFSLYGTRPLGIPFEHYIHTLSGFTVAIITDRFFIEKLNIFKRFLLLIIFALGIGAISEIIEWGGYNFLGEGEGLFFYGVGDEEPWKNTIFDLIFDALGAIIMGIYILFRKK